MRKLFKNLFKKVTPPEPLCYIMYTTPYGAGQEYVGVSIGLEKAGEIIRQHIYKTHGPVAGAPRWTWIGGWGVNQDVVVFSFDVLHRSYLGAKWILSGGYYTVSPFPHSKINVFPLR